MENHSSCIDFQTTKSERITRGWRRTFSEVEDSTIYNWVEMFGSCKWKLCALLLDHKSEKQVRDRWFNTLDPAFFVKKWESTEDYIIIKQYTIHGPKWSSISRFLDRRCPSQVKNRFYGIVKKARKKEATGESSILEICNKILKPLDSLLLERRINFDCTDKDNVYKIKSVLEERQTQAIPEKSITHKDGFQISEDFCTINHDLNNYNEEELNDSDNLLNIDEKWVGHSPARSCNSFFM